MSRPSDEVDVSPGAVLGAPPTGVDLSSASAADRHEHGVRIAVVGSDRTVRVSSTAYFLLRCADEHRPVGEIAEVLTRRTGSTVTPVEVHAAYSSVHARLRAVLTRQAPVSRLVWGRRTLLPAAWVATLAQPLVVLLAPASLAVLGAGTVLVLAGLLLHPLAAPSLRDVVVGYLLFLGGLVGHELGHAAGVLRGGARPGPIGVLVYAVWPALFTDVSVSWRLGRPQRVLVDLGGVIVQLVWTEAVALVYLVWPEPGLGYALLLSLFSVGFTLNPFLKFDGYWVLGDVLRLDDLNVDAGLVLSARVRGRPLPARIAALPRRTRLVMLAYPIAAMLAWAVLLTWSVHGLVHRLSDLPAAFVAARTSSGAALHVAVTVGLTATMVLALVFGGSALTRQVSRAVRE